MEVNMRLLNVLNNPHDSSGTYTLYMGADVSSAVDSQGTVFWSASATINGVQAVTMFIQRSNGSLTVLRPTDQSGRLLEDVRGQLTFDGKNLLLSAWPKKGTGNLALQYVIDEFVPWSGSSPPIVVSSEDTVARNMATQAIANANSANSAAMTARTIANNALTAANSKITAEQASVIAWGKAEDRFYSFLNDFRTNTRTNANNAALMDVLFGKVRDWIYGYLIERGLIK